MNSRSTFRLALENRGIRLNIGAKSSDIARLESIIRATISPSIREVMELFDGFSDDFDRDSFISVWNIDKIISRIDSKRLPYIPFADRGLDAEILEVCAIDDDKPVLIDGVESFPSYLQFWDSILSNSIPF